MPRGTSYRRAGSARTVCRLKNEFWRHAFFAYAVALAMGIPLVGLGSICMAQDSVEFFIVGASTVQVGTASFVNFNVGVKIVEGIRCYVDECGIQEVSQLIGPLHT